MWEARDREKACEQEEGEVALGGNPSLQIVGKACGAESADDNQGLGWGCAGYSDSSPQPLRSPGLCPAKGYMEKRRASKRGGSLCTEGNGNQKGCLQHPLPKHGRSWGQSKEDMCDGVVVDTDY